MIPERHKMNILADIKNCRSLAVMGGTFDPIHSGHLVAAEAVRQELEIERVLFIPAGRPPHKQSMRVAADEHRYLMTVLATANNPYFDVSRMEIDRPGMTYTIDTMRTLRKLCPADCRLYFITGADAAAQIISWKNPKDLVKICTIVAVTRPTYDKSGILKELKKADIPSDSFIFLEVPALAISSTDIRNRVAVGKTIRYLLPESVEQYIKKFDLYKHHLYGETDELEAHLGHITEDINKKLHYMLSPKRFLHTQGVAEESVKLAKKYGADTKKAYLAGLLHDCAKDYPSDEKLKMCQKYGIELDEILTEQPDLTHAFLGAEVARDVFKITDEEILGAIRFHTTGRPNMTLLEKIVYLADFFEPSRKYFDGINEIKELAYTDPDLAVAFSLDHTIKYNKKKNRVIHPLSVQALEFYRPHLTDK